MAIKVKENLTGHKYKHYDPSGKFLGELNEIQHLDLRLQIATEQVDGYYFTVEDTELSDNPDHKILIDPDGGLEYDANIELYRQALNLVIKISYIQRERAKENES